MPVTQRCYDRAIVKNLFFKLKKILVMVARKKQHAEPKRRSLPISHSVTKSVTPSINSSIQQFTVKKTYHTLLRFRPPPPQFPAGYLFSLIRSPIALSFFYPRNGSTSFVGCDSHCKANTHCTVQLRHQRKL